MSNYNHMPYHGDPERYLKLFQHEVECVTAMMTRLNTALGVKGFKPVETNQLFDMVMTLSYNATSQWNKERGNNV